MLTLLSNIKPNVIANILFISSWYPNKKDPTLGIFVKRHAEAAALYNNITVLYVQSQTGLKKPLINYFEGETVNELIIRYPKVKSNIPFLSNLIKLKQYKKYHHQGLKFLKHKNRFPNLVHCNIMNPVGLIASLWKSKYNLPYVITEHWTGYLSSDGRFQKSIILKRLIPKIANRASKILPVSADLKTALLKHNLGVNFQIVRNVVDTGKFKITDNLKDRFLVVADLEDSQKNISGLIEGFLLFSKSNPSLKLSIAGGGENEQEIRDFVSSLNLDSKIEFHGRVPAEELNILLSKSYASVLFSNYENLPCVIVESFAAGVPFISTDVGGIREIINNERGILIEPNNKIELSKALEKVIQKTWNHELIREYAVNNFSFEKIGKEFDNIYKEVIGREA